MKKALLLVSSMFILSAVPVFGKEIPVDVKDVIELRKTQFKENVEVELFTGEWIVGEDINPGRYSVTCSEDQSGNFFVYKDKSTESPDVNFILENNGFGMGVTSATMDLYEGNVIELKGLDGVMFKPVESSFTKELTTGNWVVGVDVEEGKYIATTSEDTSGNVFVYNPGEYPDGYPEFNEVLGNGENNIGTEKAQMKLTKGQVIVISGIEKLYLE